MLQLPVISIITDDIPLILYIIQLIVMLMHWSSSLYFLNILMQFPLYCFAIACRNILTGVFDVSVLTPPMELIIQFLKISRNSIPHRRSEYLLKYYYEVHIWYLLLLVMSFYHIKCWINHNVITFYDYKLSHSIKL